MDYPGKISLTRSAGGKVFKPGDFATADLVVDARYESSNHGNAGDDPINKLVKGGNQGGFRYVGSPSRGDTKFIVLYSAMDNPDWPDFLDNETGLFYYYGDNKKPGHELHDTFRKGNLLLKTVFDFVHKDLESRKNIPPIFIFTKAGMRRDVVFRGLAVPGAESVPSTEDLVAIWKSFDGKRFQNYRAIFTILDVPHIKRQWITDILNGTPFTDSCPKEWKNWTAGGVAKALKASRVENYRSKDEQLPKNKNEIEILKLIKSHYKDNPYKFEIFVAELLKIADAQIARIEVTRPYKDGGRDAIGEYRLGLGRDSIMLDFAVEAKCYGENNSVGVKETSRLISRLRYRQFGILVTTSYVAEQAYREIREDGHPIIVISGADIASILIMSGYNSPKTVSRFLEKMSIA